MKKFLTAFAAIAAGFTAQNAPAAIAQSDSDRIQATLIPESVTATKATDGGLVSIVDDQGDEFNFVLKRSSETGAMMAYHSSHSSHSSHASHRSHYSGR